MPLDSSFHFQGWTVRFQGSAHRDDDNRKPIVFVHGTPWSSDVFAPLTRALESTGRFKTFRYDLPGYGASQEFASESSHASNNTFAGDTSVKFQALALVALLQHLNLDQGVKPAVIAHDIAGAIVLRAHLLHGCEFSSLLLMDTNAVLPWGDGFYQLVRSKPEAFLELPSNIFDAVVRAVIQSACFNPQVLASGWEDTLARPWVKNGNEQRGDVEIRQKQTSFVRQIAQADDKDVAEMLDQNLYSKVRCPVKILWGADDKWIPEEKMRRLAGLLEHRLEEFVVILQAGHLIMLDQPERIACEVFSWVDRH